MDESATAELVDVTRSLMTAVRTADAPRDALDRASALVREATDLLAAHHVDGTPGQNALRVAETSSAEFATGDPARFFPYSPVVGPLNPVAPPLVVTFDGERLRGRVTLSATYAGPPGAVHGGIVAMVFDELLGAVNACWASVRSRERCRSATSGSPRSRPSSRSRAGSTVPRGARSTPSAPSAPPVK